MINIMKLAGLTVVVTMVSACAGQLYTHTNKHSACVRDRHGSCTDTYRGVLVRPLVKRTETYLQDRILNAKGEVTHFAGASGAQKCLPNKVTEEKMIPDPDREYVVEYDSAFFETTTFNVKLTAAGTLIEVGTSSTPGGKALVESLGGLVTTVTSLTESDDAETIQAAAALLAPLCSHGKIHV